MVHLLSSHHSNTTCLGLPPISWDGVGRHILFPWCVWASEYPPRDPLPPSQVQGVEHIPLDRILFNP